MAGTCKFASTTGSINLGSSIDPTAVSATGLSAPLGLIINCTKNTNLGSIVLQPVTAGQGTATAAGAGSLGGGTYTGTLVAAGSKTLPFTIEWPATTVAGNGFGAGAYTAANLTLTAKVTQAAVQAAEAGAYSSQVQVVITP